MIFLIFGVCSPFLLFVLRQETFTLFVVNGVFYYNITWIS